MEFITIDVTPREEIGSSNAARLRRTGMVPAVLYGLQRRNINLAIAGNEIERFLKTGSHLVELRLGDQVRPAILREIQYDEVTDEMLHVDFTRVDADTAVETNVPVNYKGRAAGEGEGGVFQALMQTVAVSARPKDLPREYLVDISGMALNDTLRVGDLEERSGVTFVDDASISVAPGAQLDFHNEIDLGTGSRTINVTGGGRININNDLAVGSGVWNVQSGTTLGGHGTAPGSVNSVGGAVAPGTSVGELAIGADFTMDASSTLEIEIGGLVAGDDHDVLNVIGAAALAGDLNIVLTGGFSPTNGDQFDVVVADSISGSVNLTGDSAGFSASIVGGGGDVTDGRDLLQIMRTNPAEISTWESQFGLSGGGGQILRLAFGGESQSAVPEPTTALLCLVAQSLLIVRRPRS